MKLRNILLALLTLIVGNIYAKNEVQTVAQVTTAITLSDDVDYVITGDTPFTEEGSVDIVNTDHAVVIIKKHRASAVISNWLKYIKINGRTAKNGSNCQVKMYNLGAIILPYSSTLHPLTCYTEPNFQGKSYNSYTEGHSGGFMKSLGATTLNNQIRSFKLKRGYMVTFAIGKSGWGYSRCFIAANEDLEIASLPKILDGRISSYRIFKWQNYSKKGVHDETREANAALRTEWCFGWAAGFDMLPDVENVPHHIYEDWPSASACGQATYSCHMQTNNEPANSADDHPQSVEVVLDNWQNLMRTGMRLCSPATHDGGWSWHDNFMKAIDERGWRCDIADFHGYWDGEWGSLDWRIDRYAYGRPVWFSEWVWGASWNNNGAFASGRRSDDATYNGTLPVLNRLNSTARVERYAYWNSEADFTKIWRGGALTKLGKYYAAMDTELGYKPENEFIPKTPPTQPINKDLKCVFNKETKVAKLTWSDLNGDANIDSMLLMCRKPGDADFTVMAKIELQDQNSKDACSYSYTTTALEEPGLYVFEVRNYVRTSVNSQTNQESVNISSVKETGLVTYGAVEIAGTGDVNISELNYTSETAPAAFFGNPTSNNTFGKSLRVKTQFANEVTVNLHPFVDASGAQKEMTTQEKIDFMFITPGEYIIDGKRLIVNSSDVAFGASETALKHVSFATPFDEGIKPVVIVNRVSSASSTSVWRQNSDYACEARVTNVTNEGFDIEIVRPKYYVTASKNAISSNNINYIAMEPGSAYIGNGMKLTAEYPTLERAAARYRDAYYRYSVTLGEKLLSPHFFFGTTTKSNDIFFTLNYFQNKETTSNDEQGNVWTEKIQMHRYYDLSETLSSELVDLSEDLCYIALSTDPTKDPSDEPQITTSIVDLETTGTTQSGVIYDLTGRRLQKAPQNGIYIINDGKNSSKILKK